MLPNFACARAIGNLSRVCSGVNILRRVANFEGRPLPFSCLFKSRNYFNWIFIFDDFFTINDFS